ncbi:MAG: hypothetical protein ACRCSP_03355 [Rhodoglobus sp.]
MNRNRLIPLLLVGAIVLTAALGWIVGISPLLNQAASAESERSNLAAVNDANQLKVKTLSEQFKNVETLKTELSTLRQSVPEDAGIPVLLREINGYCAQFGVTLSSVTVADTVAFTKAADPGATPAPDAATPTPAPTPAPAQGTAPNTTVTPTPSGVYMIPVTVVVSGPYANVVAFSGAMQAGPRLFLLKTLSLGSSESGFTATLDGNIFALPVPAAASAQPNADG